MTHDWLVSKARQGLDYGTSTQGKAVGAVGLLSALAGGVAGGTGDNGSIGKGRLYALLAGGAGAGLTAIGQNVNNHREDQLHKQAYADTDLLSLMADNSYIPDDDKQRYMELCSRLNRHDQDELARLLRMATGAAAGALIARYLGGKGLLTTIAGGMLGAFVGRALGPQPTFNSLGQLSVLNLYR